MNDPVLILEGLAQSAGDTIESEGILYSIGYVIPDVALSILGYGAAKGALKGADAAADTAKVANALDDIGDAAKAADTLDDISDAAKAADTVDDVSDAAKAADTVDDVGDAAKAADTVDDVSDAAKAADTVDDVGDAAKAADTVDDVGDAAKAADTVDDVGDAAKAADTVDDVGDAAKAADTVDDVGDAAKAADTVDDVGDAAKAADDIADNLYDTDGNYTGGRTQEELDALASDPDHAGSTRNSDIVKGQRERDIGLSLEETNRLDGPITRDMSGNAEFIDANGQAWDVKSFNSNYSNGYVLDKAIKNITNSFAANENVILDMTNLIPEHQTELINVLKELGLMDNIIIWP